MSGPRISFVDLGQFTADVLVAYRDQITPRYEAARASSMPRGIQFVVDHAVLHSIAEELRKRGLR